MEPERDLRALALRELSAQHSGSCPNPIGRAGGRHWKDQAGGRELNDTGSLLAHW